MWTRLYDLLIGPSWTNAPTSPTRNVQNPVRHPAPIMPTDFGPGYMVNCCFSYADEINRKQNGTYPADAAITLRELLKYDMLVFLCYLYDEDSAEPVRQIAFANELLQIKLTSQQFFSFRNENSLDPELLSRVPDSLKFFVNSLK